MAKANIKEKMELDSKYPYSGKNLFKNPEYYFYADCSSSDYLKNWKKHRNKSLKKLKQYCDLKRSKSDSDKITSKRGTLTTYLDLISQSLRNNVLGKREKYILLKFITKFEVHRRLFSYYDSNLIRRKSAPEAGFGEYTYFALVVAQCARLENGLNYTSCLIKLMDCLLSIPKKNYSYKDSKFLIQCIKIESELLDNLGKGAINR
jgi:hypothetical protein